MQLNSIEETIQSQYANSPHLLALVQGLYGLISPYQDIKLFYDSMFNLDSAQGVGLDYWGRIIGLPRSNDMVSEVGIPYFGFVTHGQGNATGFDQAPFTHKAGKHTFTLSDDAYRLFLRTKAMANISGGSLAELNRMLKELLPQCRVSITRTRPMHLKMVISGNLKDYEINMLQKGELPPIPTGVTVDMQINDAVYFGFNPDTNTPFNQGPFYRGK